MHVEIEAPSRLGRQEPVPAHVETVAVGLDPVPVRLHTEVRPEIKVWVVSEE